MIRTILRDGDGALPDLAAAERMAMEGLCRDFGLLLRGGAGAPAINRRYWESLERGESGEGVDIVRKHGGQAACAESAQGDHFIEGLAEVRMDYNDALLGHGIAADERESAHMERLRRNLGRWQLPAPGRAKKGGETSVSPPSVSGDKTSCAGLRTTIMGKSQSA